MPKPFRGSSGRRRFAGFSLSKPFVQVLKLRVLMVGSLPPPVGGMASVVVNLCAALSNEVDIQVLNNAKTTPAQRPLWRGLSAQLQLLARLIRLLVVWRPDIVHIHTCSHFTFWRNGLDIALSRLLGCRTVLHIHGAQFHEFLGALGPMRAAAARAIFKLSSRVVVLGDVWRSRLQGWCDGERLLVVPNGVPVPAAVVSPSNRPPRVLCVANYERRKGMSDLIRAMADLRDITPAELVIVGADAEPGHRESLQALVRQLGLSRTVELLGPVGPAEISARYRNADVFCLPSYNEGLPMSLLEAMAHGVPVVATKVGAIPEAVVDGDEGLLFDAGEIPQMVACLKQVMDDPAKASRIGLSGRKRVLKDFSVDASAGRVVMLYQSLCPRG